MGQEGVCRQTEEEKWWQRVVRSTQWVLLSCTLDLRHCLLLVVSSWLWKELLAISLTAGTPMTGVSTELRAVCSGEQQSSWVRKSTTPIVLQSSDSCWICPLTWETVLIRQYDDFPYKEIICFSCDLYNALNFCLCFMEVQLLGILKKRVLFH